MKKTVIVVTSFLVFLGLVQARAEEFFGVRLPNHVQSIEDLRLTYGDGPDAFSAGVFLLEFLKVQKNDLVWVSLSPKAKPFTVISPVIADTLVGKELLKYDLKLKRDAMEWLSRQGIWKEESLFRCWIEPSRVWIEENDNKNAWIVKQIDLFVQVELLGQKFMPEWAQKLKDYLTKKINYGAEYAGLRDIVRAWVLSRFLMRYGMGYDLSPVAWSKMKILERYRKLFGSDAVIGGVILRGEIDVEEKTGETKRYRWERFSDYFGVGFYKVKFYNEETWESEDVDSVKLRVFLKNKQEAEYLAKLMYDFDRVPKEFLREIFEDFFSKEASEALIDFVEERLKGLQRLRIFSFPSKGHDLYGLSVLKRDKKAGMILMSEDCFEGVNLNKKGKYVLIYEIVQQALSFNREVVEMKYLENKATYFEAVLRSPNREQVLLRRKDIEELFGNDGANEYKWRSLFSRMGPLGNFATVIFGGAQKERSVNRLIMVMLAKSKEPIQVANRWIAMGHELLFDRLRKMKDELECFRVFNDYLFEHYCSAHFRLDIIREIRAQDFSPDEISELLEFLDVAYDCFGPHMLNPMPKDPKQLKWAYKKFWSAVYRSVIYYRGLIAKNKEDYKEGIKLIKNWLSRYKEERKEWAGRKSIYYFYSNLSIFFTSPKNVKAWNIVNKASLMPLISPPNLMYFFLRFSSELLANQVFTYPSESIYDYDLSTGKLTINSENVFLFPPISTKLFARWNTDKLVDFVNSIVILPELKERLTWFIQKKGISIEIRSFDFIPGETPLYIDLENKIIFLPEVVFRIEESDDLRNELILLSLLELAFQEGMSIRDLISLDEVEKDERLLWRYGYNLYLENEKLTRGLAWFFWMINMKRRGGEDYREKIICDLLFYQGRITMVDRKGKEKWLARKMREAMRFGKESFWTEKVLPSLISGKSVSSSRYNKTLFATISLLKDIANGKGSIYGTLKDRTWFKDVFLPTLERCEKYLTNSPIFVRQRLASAFLISLVDAISLDVSFEDGETNKVLENMAMILAHRVSKVGWDLAFSLRNGIIKSMEKEKEKVGGIAL